MVIISLQFLFLPPIRVSLCNRVQFGLFLNLQNRTILYIFLYIKYISRLLLNLRYVRLTCWHSAVSFWYVIFLKFQLKIFKFPLWLFFDQGLLDVYFLSPKIWKFSSYLCITEFSKILLWSESMHWMISTFYICYFALSLVNGQFL